MARKLTVLYEHAVYDTYNHQGGANLSVDPGDLTNLLMAVDGGDRRPGYFFETLGDKFVFGFERMREDDHGKSRNMAYFDLFVTPVENVEEVPITAIRDSLEMECVANYESTPESEVAIKYKLDKEDDQAEGFVNPNQNRVDPVFIAENWERYRSSSKQLQLPLQDLERFVNAVDGILPKLSYLSQWADGEVAESDYFDAVEGPQNSSDVVAEELLQRVKDLQNEDELSYENLPQYEDVLEREVAEQQSAIVDDGLSDEINHVFERGAELTRSKVEDFPSEAPELIEDALSDDLVDEEADDEDTDEDLWKYYGAAALCGLVISAVSAVASTPIGSAVGRSALTGWVVVSGLGVFLVGLVIAEIGRYKYSFDTKTEQKRAGTAWSVLVVGTLVVGIAIVYVMNTFVPISLTVDSPFVTVDIANFVGTSVGLLIGGTAMFLLGKEYREIDRRARQELSLLERHSGSSLDDEVLIVIDEQLQEEADSINEWLEDELAPRLKTDLQQKVKENAKQSAERTVTSIEDLKQMDAYEEVRSLDGSD